MIRRDAWSSVDAGRCDKKGADSDRFIGDILAVLLVQWTPEGIAWEVVVS